MHTFDLVKTPKRLLLSVVLVEPLSVADSCSKDPDLACVCFTFGIEGQNVHAESKNCCSSMVIPKGMVQPEFP